MMTDHHPQQLSLDFDGIPENSLQKRTLLNVEKIQPAKSASVINFANFLQERKKSETVQLYENILESIKHMG
jgi:hypothetical protein